MKEQRKDEGVRALTVPKPVRCEVARLELLRRIEEAQDARIIALISPSGYGKTTLLAQYARATRRPVAWVTLSEDQRCPARLLEVLHASLRGAQPNLPFRHYQQLRAEAQPAGLARALARDLQESGANLRIVLDQAHHLDEAACAIIDAFVGQLDEGHQVLTSAYTARFKVANYQLLDQALVLDENDLRFSVEESAGFLAARQFAGDVRNASNQVEGWPAGLALVSVGASPHLRPEQLIFEALDRLPEQVRAVLPDLGSYDLWSADLPAELGVEPPAHWLSEVRASGLPVTPLTPALFRPHGILLNALRSLLDARSSAGRGTYRRAGELYLKNNRPIQAIRAFKQAGEEHRVVTLLNKVVPSAAARHEHQLVYDLLQLVPVAALPDALKVALGDALVYLGQKPAGDALLGEVRSSGYVDRNLDIALTNTLSISGQYQQALDIAERAIQTSDLEDAATLRLRRIRIHLLSALNRDDEAHLQARLACDAAKATGDLRQVSAVLSVALRLAMKRLDFRETEQVAQEILAKYEYLHEPFLAAQAAASLIDYLRYCWRLDEAFTVYGRAGVLLGDALPSNNVDALMLRECEGDLLVAAGQVEPAVARYLAIARQLDFTSDHLFRLRLYGKLAELYSRLGQSASVEECLGQLRRCAALHPNGGLHLAYFEGVVHGLQGHWPEARQQLFKLGTFPLPFDRRLKRALYLAEAQLQTGQDASTQLLEIRHLLARLPLTASLAVETANLPQVCNRLNLGREGRKGAATGTVMQDVHPCLSVTTINGFAVCVDGRSLKIAHSKSREILLWLALNGPGTREELVEAIWGDAQHPNHIEYFKVSVRRLRNALAGACETGLNPVVFDRQRYALAPDMPLKVDCLELSDAVTRGETERTRLLLPEGRLALLPGVRADWLEFARSTFQETAYAALLQLARRSGPVSCAERAALLRRAIELEPLEENGYLNLIELWVRNGQPSQAELVSQQYGKTVRQELGVEPTAAFFEHLDALGLKGARTGRVLR